MDRSQLRRFHPIIQNQAVDPSARITDDRTSVEAAPLKRHHQSEKSRQNGPFLGQPALDKTRRHLRRVVGIRAEDKRRESARAKKKEGMIRFSAIFSSFLYFLAPQLRLAFNLSLFCPPDPQLSTPRLSISRILASIPLVFFRASTQGEGIFVEVLPPGVV